MLKMEMVPGDIHHFPGRVGADLEDLIYGVFVGEEPTRETDRPKRPVGVDVVLYRLVDPRIPSPQPFSGQAGVAALVPPFGLITSHAAQHRFLAFRLLRDSKRRGVRDFEFIDCPRYIPNFEERISYSIGYVFYCFSYDSVLIQSFLVAFIG